MNREEARMIALSTLIARATQQIIPIHQEVYAVHLDFKQSSEDNLVYYRFPVVGLATDQDDNADYITHGPDGPRFVDRESHTFVGFFTAEDYLGEVMQEHGRFVFNRG